MYNYDIKLSYFIRSAI